jgi:hypothetical protein
MYTTEQLAEKTYSITTDFEGQEITFNVIVANDESEIDELVQFHLNYLRNPNPVIIPQEPSKSTDEIIQEQQAIITDLTTRLEALEAK